MKTPNRLLYWGVIFVFVLGLVAVPGKNVQAAGVINLTTMGTAYTQNFNTLANTGTTNNIDALNNGWYLTESGGGARDNELYGADNGASNVGDSYSYGADSSPERALGGLRSGTLVPVYGASFTNNTGSVITSLVIAYTGEEWRLGTAGRTDQLTFEYSTNAASLTTGTWTGVPALDFITPDTAAIGAKNGNATGEHTSLSATVSGLNIANGTTFWIHWLDSNALGADDGLAIDDFSLTPQGAALRNVSINDISLKEGNNGTTTFTFTVSLSAPAPVGGVTFDIATANNTAFAPGDYTAKSLTGQTIPVGSSIYRFSVLVNGDPTAESDETFIVNVTNVNGATVTGGLGLGTINNDDTTTAIATSGSPSGFGAPMTFTATVTEPGAGTPTGTVEFFDGAASLGTGTLDAGGQATFTTASLATGSHTITATYGGDVNFSGSTTVPGITQVIEGPPGVSLINSSADTGDGQVLENEHTNVAITQLLVVFNKAMNTADVENESNYRLALAGLPDIPINLATYDNGTLTVTLNINSGVALPNGRYTLTVNGAIEDTLGAPIGANFVRTFFVDNGHPHHISVVTIPDDSAITNGATVNVRFSSIDITFDEDLDNAGGGAGIDDVTNPQNYLLVTPGPNGMFDTPSCVTGITGDDVQIPTGTVSYTNNSGNGPFVATVQFNGGTALENGTYRLFICGTTSIVDLAGNPLNNGLDEQLTFNVLVTDPVTGNPLRSVKRNPRTGFAPGMVTVLPEQPAEKAYADLGDLWIEIPKLNLKTGITGVPLEAGDWDVTWLNWQVGWLEGTAYPTWEGNTVLTAHGYTADGEAGPFALLRNLSYGETIVIHLGGLKYTYAVRTNLLINSNDTRWLTKHEKLDWVTLITCQQYDAKTKSYRYRRVVRAVLISVEKE